jgi:hypothetical protein
MSNHRLLALLTVVSVLLISSALQAGETILTTDVVRSSFSARTNEEARPYDLDPASVHMLAGSFTAPASKEAVVWFVDRNQSHAAAGAELWLMRDDGAWNPVLIIEQSDDIYARTIDAGGKGISAVLVSASHFSTGGFISSHWALVSLYGGTVGTTFSAAGNDFAFYTMYKQVGGKDKIVTHQVSFRDAYDSAAELIDTELSGAFVHTGKGDSGYEVRWTPVATTTYRLVVDKNGAVTGVEKIQ